MTENKTDTASVFQVCTLIESASRDIRPLLAAGNEEAAQEIVSWAREEFTALLPVFQACPSSKQEHLDLLLILLGDEIISLDQKPALLRRLARTGRKIIAEAL